MRLEKGRKTDIAAASFCNQLKAGVKMFYKNWITRFIVRKDFFRRVKMRLDLYKRLITMELVEDIARLYQGEKPSVIVDAGANIGFVTHQFRALFPSADIYSFEPNPSVFAILKKIIGMTPKSIRLTLVLGTKKGN